MAKGGKSAEEIRRLKAEIDRLLARIRQLEKDVQSRDDEIAGLRAMVERLEDQVRSLER